MRRLANISITITTLILLTFGASGISLAKCACSGKTSLLTMSDIGCCPSEGDCMTVTTVQLSDSDVPVHIDAPQLIATVVEMPRLANVLMSECVDMSVATALHGTPPPRISFSTVLRV